MPKRSIRVLQHPEHPNKVVLEFQHDSFLVSQLKAIPGAEVDSVNGKFKWVCAKSSLGALRARVGAKALESELDLSEFLKDLPNALHIDPPTLKVLPDFKPRFPTYAALVAPEKAMTEADHQATGSSWLIENPTGIQGDDMGLGKSKMFIDAARHVWASGMCNRVLIVAKSGNVFTWVEELAKFDPDAVVYVATGTVKRREKKYSEFLTSSAPALSYLIVSYEVLRSDIDTVSAMKFDWVLCDEAHKLKSTPINDAQSQIAAIIHRIRAPRMHAMTGTVLVNAPEDAWNILTWLGIETRSWKTFEAETCRTIKYKISQWTELKKITGYNPLGIEKLRALLIPNFIRREKRDVTTLPAVVKKDVLVTLNPEEQKYYTEAEKDLQLSLAIPNVTLPMIKAIPNDNVQKIRLKQITSTIEPFIGKPYKSTKIATAIELTEEAIESGQKVIIFSQYLAAVHALKRELAAYKPVVVTGVSEDRQADVNAFRTDPERKIFIGSTSACREGITLTAASVVIFIDLEWSPTYVAQAIDRANRIGQTRSVTVYTLVARQRNGRDTIDTGIQANLETKEVNMERVLG